MFPKYVRNPPTKQKSPDPPIEITNFAKKVAPIVTWDAKATSVPWWCDQKEDQTVVIFMGLLREMVVLWDLMGFSWIVRDIYIYICDITTGWWFGTCF